MLLAPPKLSATRAFAIARIATWLALAGLLATACTQPEDGTVEANASTADIATTTIESTPSVDGSLTEEATPEIEAGDPGASAEHTAQASVPATVDAAPATTTTTTTAPTTTTTAPIVRSAMECASDIPLDVRIGQLMFPVLTQDEFGDAQSLATQGHLGGVVVLGSPSSSIKGDIERLQASSLVGPMIVAVDEEGGRVQRLESVVGRQPSAREVAANETPAVARERARAHATALGELGFTMNLAPVVDLDTGSFIGDRSYGSDPDLVTAYAFEVADGILDGGLSPVLKHFPGHGAGTDSHFGLPTLPELDELRTTDLVPFERGAARGDLPIMVGHLVVPGLTDGQPATLSRAAVTGLLRGELGFNGLVMTDAFNMEAISATTNNADAAELAIGAGVDLVMLGTIREVGLAVEQLVDAVTSGRLSDEAVTTAFLRVMQHRNLELCALPEHLRPAIGCEFESQTACR